MKKVQIFAGSTWTWLFVVSCAGFLGNSVWAAGENKLNLLKQMRSQLDAVKMSVANTSILMTDETLYRYLKQSNFRIENAVSRVQKTAQWRQSNKVDNLLQDDISILKDLLPYEQTGETQDGNPVFYIPIGKWNLRKVQRSSQNSRFQSYITKIFEQSLRSASGRVNKRTQEPNSESVFIIDLQGLTLGQALSGYGRTLSTFARSARIYDQHYPNTVKKWYVIRAPKNFRVVWALARRFVPRDVTKNVEVFSRYSMRWRNVLKSSIPNDALPKTLRI